ncbi:DUF5954 family protein [Streptomyces sp. SCSIO ZS0520]|uniref:DUF5954 family protein n=1 Tax=Streptomyces sp. SCSIO ZS0520 TaxID=2892996 RepID=UPI0021D94722|nr:DUF5954 family protein [Streptomyces sp. SCSIO ZS0520]
MVDDWKRQLDALHAGLRERDHPAELVAETEAMEASERYPGVALRGPVFGVAVQDPARGPEWRVLKSVTDGTPQQARDALQSYLWFRAKDDTEDRTERRALLAAVSVLEREPVDEVEVLGARYRVIRGDEFARGGMSGLEPPRATDPEPLKRVWEHQPYVSPDPEGFVLEPGHGETSLSAGALRLGLREFAYTDFGFPSQVRRESEASVRSHPGIVLLPVAFGVIEKDGPGWTPHGVLMPTPHDARLLLYDGLREFWAKIYRLDARVTARYAAAAEEFRAAERANEARVGGEVYRICRVERLVRVGGDGPEPPRASDVETSEPMALHPKMDEDGTIHFGS